MTIRVENTVRFDKVGNIDVSALDVGFFATATYDDGTPVASVAATHEFGTSDGRIPERPFMRPALRAMARGLGNTLASGMRSNGLNLGRREAERIGEQAVGEIQESITAVNSPPLAPATVARKGSTNPLVDTGEMRRQVGYEVVA